MFNSLLKYCDVCLSLLDLSLELFYILVHYIDVLLVVFFVLLDVLYFDAGISFEKLGLELSKASVIGALHSFNIVAVDLEWDLLAKDGNLGLTFVTA